MLWIYLNRCSESSTSVRKRLDTILRICFTTGGGLYSADLPIQPFVNILRYVLVKQPEYGKEFITEFLQGDVQVHTDRTTSLVTAIGYALQDFVEERPPPWPQSADFTSFAADEEETPGDLLPEDVAAKPDIEILVQHASVALTDLLITCDRSVGFLLLSNDSVNISSSASSAAMEGQDQVTRKNGDVYSSYAARFNPGLRLILTLLDLLPRCLDTNTNFAQIANVLCRCSFSADPDVAGAACSAMRRCGQDAQRCSTLAYTYLQFVFETRHIFRDTFVGVRLLESQFERVIQLWLELLQSLVGHQRLASEDSPKMTKAMIEKIEGCGLFLLCSTSVPLRHLGIQVLLAARDLEPQQRLPSAAFRYSRVNPGKQNLSRVIQLLEATMEETDINTIRALPWLNSSDRHRMDSLAEDRKRMLIRIAESDNPKDAQLWLSLLPYCILRLSDSLPDAALALRSIVISSVLRMQGHVALVASSASRATQGMRANPVAARNTSDIGALADHWRSYLSVLCVTMTAPASIPATPPVQRTREAVILTPDTIGSPALFHYLASLFSWDDPRYRDAAVYASGSIGQLMLKQMSEILLGVIRKLADGTKMVSRDTTRRSATNGPLWTAIAHVFRLISPLLLEPRSAGHLANLSSAISFVKITQALLCERLVKEDYDLQSLRRSFCMVVENLCNALGKLDSSERFLGEDMRGAIFKLCYEWCHVGRRPDVAKARESHTLQAAAEGYRGERDRAQYLEDLQAKTKLLSAAAAEAMAGLCVSRHDVTVADAGYSKAN